jgi:protein-S-isoprenylcysteine O-methyltransferase Ste14
MQTTQQQTMSPPMASQSWTATKRWLALAYGALCYAAFFGVFLYLIGFVGNLVVPKSLDSGPAYAFMPALLVNLFLIALFAIQHTIMARWQFKRHWIKIVPRPIERSTFVLVTSVLLAVIFWQWRTMPGVVWEVENAIGRSVLQGLFWVGWLIVLTSTYLINHFELFGLEQVYRNLRGQKFIPPKFTTPLLYKLVRHPMMTGMIIAFWATPRMTVGHLVFAAGMTAYIFMGTYFEEKDLVHHLGDDYPRYQKEVPNKFVSFRSKR